MAVQARSARRPKCLDLCGIMLTSYSPDPLQRAAVAAIAIARWDAERSRNAKAAPVGEDYPWGWNPPGPRDRYATGLIPAENFPLW